MKLQTINRYGQSYIRCKDLMNKLGYSNSKEMQRLYSLRYSIPRYAFYDVNSYHSRITYYFRRSDVIKLLRFLSTAPNPGVQKKFRKRAGELLEEMLREDEEKKTNDEAADKEN